MANETIQISKESVDTFNHDKNVVDMTMKELYEPLLKELHEIGYTNLRIVNKWMRKYAE